MGPVGVGSAIQLPRRSLLASAPALGEPDSLLGPRLARLGELTRLPDERDQNLRLDTEAGSFSIKIAHAATS